MPAHYELLREKLRQLVRNLGLLDDRSRSCCGISLAQCHALIEIGRAGSLSLGALAKILGLDKSTSSRAVERLVRQGYARRQVNEKNRRQTVICLSENGRQLFCRTEEEMNDYFASVMDHIDPGIRSEITANLQILLDAMVKAGSAVCSCEPAGVADPG